MYDQRKINLSFLLQRKKKSDGKDIEEADEDDHANKVSTMNTMILD